MLNSDLPGQHSQMSGASDISNILAPLFTYDTVHRSASRSLIPAAILLRCGNNISILINPRWSKQVKIMSMEPRTDGEKMGHPQLGGLRVKRNAFL